MSIKEKLKNNDFLRIIVRKLKIYREFMKDAEIFSKYYYVDGRQQQTQLEYRILLLVHGLEKGMCLPSLRQFGYEKCKQLTTLLTNYNKYSYDSNSTAYLLGNAILKKWLSYYKMNGWQETDIYAEINTYVNNNPVEIESRIEVGHKEHIKSEIMTENNYFADVVNSRFSVRNFSEKPLDESDIIECVKIAIKAPTACNKQMCKIYNINNLEGKNYLSKTIQGTVGFDLSTVHYFVITFDIAAFNFYGERNQGYLNAGLVAMNFANALHYKGIGSCFMQLGNTFAEEQNMKKKLGISDNERIAIMIGAGYYVERSKIPCSCRKTVDEIYIVCQ